MEISSIKSDDNDRPIQPVLPNPTDLQSWRQSAKERGTMKVYVVFDFPEITDVNSPEADFAIDSLSEDLTGFARDGEYEWYIDDAEEEIKNG